MNEYPVVVGKVSDEFIVDTCAKFCVVSLTSPDDSPTSTVSTRLSVLDEKDVATKFSLALNGSIAEGF